MIKNKRARYQIHCPSCGAWKYEDEPCEYCGLIVKPQIKKPEDPSKVNVSKKSPVGLLIFLFLATEVISYFLSSYFSSNDAGTIIAGIFISSVLYSVIIVPIVLAIYDY